MKMIGIADYILYWPNVADNALWEPTWQIKAQHQTGTYARGFTMESVYWSHRGWKCYNLYMKQRQNKTWTKIIQKNDTKCILYPLHRSDRAIRSMHFKHTDLLGNTHPLKVDRNLQWMSYHPTNPTYNPVLSGTMTHLSAQCLNSTTRTLNTNTYTQKVCIRYLTYCMPTLWKWFMTCNT